MFSNEQIAELCHEVNAAYCRLTGDDSQPAWADAPDWQKESAINGVEGVISGNSPEQSHESWLAEKEKDGWSFGEVKDPEKKEHPCFVPYDSLPAEQKIKDDLYVGVVRALAADEIEAVGSAPDAEESDSPTPSVLADRLIAATEGNPLAEPLRHVLEAFITAEKEQPPGSQPGDEQPEKVEESDQPEQPEVPAGLTITRAVVYRSKTGAYDLPAVVTATVDTIDPKGVSLGHVPELTGPSRVHLTVFTCGKQGTAREGNVVNNEAAGGSYQEFNIPQFVVPEVGAEDAPVEVVAGTWRWPARV